MDRIQKEILFKEVKNMRRDLPISTKICIDSISQEYNYRNINELIGHYIEEGIINSRKELIIVVGLIKNKLKININIKNFQDCWAN